MTTRQVLDCSLTPLDNTRLAHLCGALDSNLQQLEIGLNLQIARRNENFRLFGEDLETLRRAAELLKTLYVAAKKPLLPEDIQLALIEHHSPANTAVHEPVLAVRRGELRGRTPRQSDYLQAILQHDISFGIGPAGTGKTYLAVACALDALERDAVKRIILTRPAVEAGERLGFLPGDLNQKVDPYLRPLYDALYDLAGFERVSKWFERGVIEIAPLAYMRGRTLNHAFVILDEAQNTTPEQMKMFLTRIGFGAKAVVTGDLTQTDLARGQKSGLREAIDVLPSVRGIAFCYFTAQDVVRHPLVARIVEAYDAFTAGKSHANA